MGQVVFVEHTYQNEPFVAVYGHIKYKDTLGTTVKRGECIGWVDKTMYGPNGESNPHLHFGLFKDAFQRDGKQVFPTSGWGAMYPNEFPGKWVDPGRYIE
ncbi:MAG: peptidoglycan DD-metalloendopeptidase family protein [Armatimonadota bacterium]